MEIFKKIAKELFEKDKGNSLNKYLKSNIEFANYLDKMIEKEIWFKDRRTAFRCLVKDINEKKFCQKCGKELDVKKALDGRFFCNAKCFMNSDYYKNKTKETNLKKYGTESSNSSNEVKERKKQSILKKYGVEHTSLLKETKEKIKNTSLKKYGVENVMQNNKIKKKQQNTCLEKYGVKNVSQSFIINEKRNKIFEEKYGCHPLQLKETRDKIKETCLEKYGVISPLLLEKNKTKGNDYYIQEGWKTISSWKDYVIPLFSEKEYEGHNKEYKWKCIKCGNEFISKIYTTGHLGSNKYIPRCWKCFPQLCNFSYKENEVLEFIKSIYSGEIIENDRKVLEGKELDIYLPFKNLAIEFDGLFWHNSENKDKNYHLLKTEKCKEKGIQLIHIFEDEWINKRLIVEDRIKSILGIYDKKIYARKCEVKEIDRRICNEFLEENHLQGKDNSSIRLGLFYEGNLVSVMTFGKPRFNFNFNYELVRFAIKMGYQVVGAASRLLCAFKRKYQGSIISYADRRYSKGKLYESLKFELIGKSEPNYFYVKGLEKYSRYQCQKHKLSKILGDKFDVNLSETENMILNGFYKIYDCGNLVYIMK